MNIDRYTNRAKEVLQNAQTLAIIGGNQIITAEHLLMAMLEEDSRLTHRIIEIAGGNVAAIAENLKFEIEKLPKVSGSGYSEPRLSPEIVRILPIAEKISSSNGDEFVTLERLLQ
ncbi:MAG: hypothetical protein LBP39_00455, partial [Rickettsiales bacterium]|nr:hypothetical protein [Rickettsiales bacterium]